MRKAVCGMLLLSGVMASAPAFAQAWMPPRGEGSVTVAFQWIENTGHVDMFGQGDRSGQSTDASIYLESEYALSDRWSFAVGLPFVFTKFDDLKANPPLPWDACHCWQHGWQDFGLTARYALLNGRTAVTPSVSYGVPSHGYPYQGEAVVGRGLQEVRLAVDVGRRLDEISPKLAIQGRYSYAFVENVLDVPNNRSNGSLVASYQVGRALSLQALITGQVTHGGLNAPPGPPQPPPPDQIENLNKFLQHDRIMNDDNWRPGVGVTYHRPTADYFFSYLNYAGGRTTHRGYAFTVGLNVPFGGSSAPPQ